jgi:hypothetical protein
MSAASQSDSLIQWSPHSASHFVVYNNDLRLYHVRGGAQFHAHTPQVTVPGDGSGLAETLAQPHTQQQQPQTLRTQHTTSSSSSSSAPSRVQCLGSLMYQQQVISCLDWSLDPSRPYSIAAGLPSGRVVILDFQKELDSLRDDRCVRKPMCVSVEF